LGKENFYLGKLNIPLGIRLLPLGENSFPWGELGVNKGIRLVISRGWDIGFRVQRIAYGL
jgi:hypothetical protein